MQIKIVNRLTPEDVRELQSFAANHPMPRAKALLPGHFIDIRAGGMTNAGIRVALSLNK